MEYTHTAVMPQQVLQGLNVIADGIYVDCTFGCGGHSERILSLLSMTGRLLAFDKDTDAALVAKKPPFNDERFLFVQGTYTLLPSVLQEKQWLGKVNGIVADLGVSSVQLDNPARGFSYRHDAPLDMRMDQRNGRTVAQWLQNASEKEIADVIFQYGEEPAARRIARRIIHERQHQPINTTGQLAAVVAASNPATDRRNVHPITRTFQALRIHINHELEDLRTLLDSIPAALAPLGRLVVISFHSLEDRIVKRFIRRQKDNPQWSQMLPVMPPVNPHRLFAIGKMQRPDAVEVEKNPRARSAVLRVAGKVVTC